MFLANLTQRLHLRLLKHQKILHFLKGEGYLFLIKLCPCQKGWDEFIWFAAFTYVLQYKNVNPQSSSIVLHHMQ